MNEGIETPCPSKEMSVQKVLDPVHTRIFPVHAYDFSYTDIDRVEFNIKSVK